MKTDLDEHLSSVKSIFTSFHPLYPNLPNFLNKVKYELGPKFLNTYRKQLQAFYYAQEVVQIFQPPPQLQNLGSAYYPKMIAFYPFERLFSDTAKITIYSTTRKEANRRDVVIPVATDKEKETETPEYIKNITENLEIRFPKELRFTYSSGKVKKGSKPADQMPEDLKIKRAEYIVANPENFNSLKLNNAKKVLQNK